MNTQDLSRNEIQTFPLSNNLITPKLKIKKENTIKERDLRMLTINPLTESPESNDKRKNIKKLFYHRRNNYNDFSSICNISKINENNKKKESHVSKTNIFIGKSKNDKQSFNKNNKNHLMTINKDIKLYDSNNYLSYKTLKFSLEKIKLQIRNESNPNILKGINVFKKDKTDKKSIIKNLI